MRLLAWVLATSFCNAIVTLDRSMRTIGGAVKGERVSANTEKDLFASPLGDPGVITEQWFSIFGGDEVYSKGADPTIRVYLGGKLSMEYRLFMAHGLGPMTCGNDYKSQKNCVDPAVSRVVANDSNAFSNRGGRSSWANSFMGHASTGGALKNTYRIPFGADGIRVTMEQPFDGVVYYYCRGMTNYPLIVGDLQLPGSARLRLYQNINVAVQPQQRLGLVPRHNSSGLLFQVTLAAESDFIGFMEGCVRAHIDDGNESGTNSSALPPLLLSSGTEDYFEGANFFDTGLMTSPEAGVTWVSGRNPGPYAMSAYKHHVRDPVVWWETIELTASNYDPNGVKPEGGSTMGNSSKVRDSSMLGLKPAIMSSYAWTYEW